MRHHQLIYTPPVGKLYAVGGYDGASRQCLSTVEAYDPVTNEWSYVADMSTRRSGAGSSWDLLVPPRGPLTQHQTSCHLSHAPNPLPDLASYSKIHRHHGTVSTGRPTGQLLLSPVMFAMSKRGRRRAEWSRAVLAFQIAPFAASSRWCCRTITLRHSPTSWGTLMHLLLFFFWPTGVGVLSGQLYAAGGHDGPLVRKSVEVYDPPSNTWKQVCDMNMCRRNAGETHEHNH